MPSELGRETPWVSSGAAPCVSSPQPWHPDNAKGGSPWLCKPLTQLFWLPTECHCCLNGLCEPWDIVPGAFLSLFVCVCRCLGTLFQYSLLKGLYPTCTLLCRLSQVMYFNVLCNCLPRMMLLKSDIAFILTQFIFYSVFLKILSHLELEIS